MNKKNYQFKGFIVNKDYEIIREADKTVPCKICGDDTHMLGTQLCNGCWEVSCRLREFLQNKAGREMAQAIIDEFVHEGEK